MRFRLTFQKQVSKHSSKKVNGFCIFLASHREKKTSVIVSKKSKFLTCYTFLRNIRVQSLEHRLCWKQHRDSHSTGRRCVQISSSLHTFSHILHHVTMLGLLQFPFKCHSRPPIIRCFVICMGYILAPGHIPRKILRYKHFMSSSHNHSVIGRKSFHGLYRRLFSLQMRRER